jgi:hypothetical protein
MDDAYLTRVTIPNSVTRIDGLAFADNYLASVDIGDRVMDIGQSAFARNRLTNVDIPDSVTRIMPGAFHNNSLTSITIGNSVEINESPALGNAMGVHGVDFRNFYIENGQRAGLYTFAGGSWSWQP